MVTPLLEGTGLVRRYGGRAVLNGVDIAVQAGEVLAVVGPNGAGKSTLFRVLQLLERADTGTVRMDGQAVDGDVVRRRVAGVFQRPLLFSGSARDNVEFGLRVRGVRGAELESRTTAALEWFGLGSLADARVHGLSGGEAQRVALARAVAVEPDVLLLDEPTANLDATIRRRFRSDLESVARRRARAIVLITHDPAEALGLADRVVVLADGRVVQEGTPEELLLRPGSPFIAELTGAELLLQGRVAEVQDTLARVAVGDGVELWATSASAGLAAGADAVVAYRPEDVILSREGADTSAVNRVAGRVAALVPAGGLVRVRVDAATLSLTALLTRRSVEALELEPGATVVAHMKAAALHAWRRDIHD